jgi:signal transduction histidine kinase
VHTAGTAACGDELAQRATAVALGMRRRRQSLGLPSDLARRIDACEGRAVALTTAAGNDGDAGRAAAMELVAEAVSMLLLERALSPADARAVVARIAETTGRSVDATTLAVFLRALRSRAVTQLPPGLAMELVARLVVALAPADAVSVWAPDDTGRLACVASAGDAPESRRLRVAARSALAGGVHDDSTHIHSQVVDRWDSPFAALAARGRPDDRRLGVFLQEAAAAISPLLERSMLFERNAARERELVSATERRLVRLGFDLHDGPMQEIVALAADIHQARLDVESLLDGKERALVAGRLDDFEARLGELDRGLRDVAHSVRSTSAVDQPLEHAVRRELDALQRSSTVDAELSVEGDVATLTASQKIALFRVAQECLSNIGKHSHATHAWVELRAERGYVTLSVRDDGCGYDASSLPGGRLGLAGVVERVRLLGGDVVVDGRPGLGVNVQVTLPRWRPADEPTQPVYAVAV